MLDITLIQTELTWEDPAANRAHFESRLADVADTDLIVLPEMFPTGFSMASERLAEPPEGDTVQWMKAIAAEHDAAVCGSVITRDQGRHYNRFYLAGADGTVHQYDKRHLFRMGEENDHYSPGTTRITCPVGEFTVFPQVCYDLRFPVFSRNDLGFDVMVYVANWPAPRREHWRTLLRARAVENLCYVVGLNRIGSDERDINYAGDSAVIDFSGETLIDLGGDDRVANCQIEKALLDDYREHFPAWKDADPFQLGI